MEPKRSPALGVLLCAVCLFSLTLGTSRSQPRTLEQEFRSLDSPTPHPVRPALPQRLGREANEDTTWFGGDDGTGVAFAGGVWDWDTLQGDSLQGWTGRDGTADPALYFQRVTPADFIEHGDPCVPVTEGGMLWCGVHEDDAQRLGFLAGMGYPNYMGQWARSPSAELASPLPTVLNIEFSYFCNQETYWDYTTVLLRWCGADETCLGDTLLDQLTGVVGSPDQPASYARTVELGALPAGTFAVQLEFQATSDAAWSDEDGLWDSPCGPIGIDNVSVSMEGASADWNFDQGPDGWTFGILGRGLYTGVIPEQTWQAWLDSVGVSGCELDGRVWEFVAQETSPNYPPGIPELVHQQAISGPVARGPYTDWPTTIIEWDGYSYTPFYPNWFGLDGAVQYMYYPYTTPADSVQRWSPPLYCDFWYLSPQVPECSHRLMNLSTPGYGGTPIPADWDSMKVVFSLWAHHAGPSHWIDCLGAPLLDNVRVGLVRSSSSVIGGGGSGASPRLRVSSNPARGEALLELVLPNAEEVHWEICDAGGRRVRDLGSAALPAGRHVRSWDGTDDAGRPAASGVYWAVIRGSGDRQRVRFVLLR